VSEAVQRRQHNPSRARPCDSKALTRSMLSASA